MLNVERLHVSIKGFPILRGVTLEISAGGLVGLVGRNGAGKTSTLKGILGLVPVTGGRIALDGTDLSKVPAHKRAPLGIGYMPEDRRLIGALTVEDNILMLARAVMTGTKLLLLDEAFEGLSPATGEKFARTIQALQREGLAILIAESDDKRLDFVDTIYTIERGEIVEPAGAVPTRG